MSLVYLLIFYLIFHIRDHELDWFQKNKNKNIYIIRLELVLLMIIGLLHLGFRGATRGDECPRLFHKYSLTLCFCKKKLWNVSGYRKAAYLPLNSFMKDVLNT